MKHEADKAEENVADADDAMEVPNKKRKVDVSVGEKWHQIRFSAHWVVF